MENGSSGALGHTGDTCHITELVYNNGINDECFLADTVSDLLGKDACCP
jgi:hypothetical protein